MGAEAEAEVEAALKSTASTSLVVSYIKHWISQVIVQLSCHLNAQRGEKNKTSPKGQQSRASGNDKQNVEKCWKMLKDIKKC